MIKLEVDEAVAVDVARLLIREQAQYSSVEGIVPQRIVHLREFIDQIADKVKDGTVTD